MKGKITLFLAAIMVSLALGSYVATSVEVVGQGGYDDTKLVIDLKNVSVCGDGICGTDEYCGSCPEDCGKCPKIDVKWPYKYTVDISKFIEKEPETDIGVVIVLEEEIRALGLKELIEIICLACRICASLCDNFLPFLNENGFNIMAITPEGHILGTVKAGNVPQIAEHEYVSIILPDDGISAKMGGIDLKIEPLIIDINTTGGIDMDTKEGVVIPTGEETQIGDVKIRVDREPYRFLGIIPIPWVESDNFKMEISNETGKEVSIVKEGSSITINNKMIEIGELQENMIKISVARLE